MRCPVRGLSAWRKPCSPRRDLPNEFGSFRTAHKRLIRWAVDGARERILAAVRSAADGSDDAGWTVPVDSTACRAHQHAAGAGKKKRGAPGRTEPDGHGLGRSRGCPSTKVHLSSHAVARHRHAPAHLGRAGVPPGRRIRPDGRYGPGRSRPKVCAGVRAGLHIRRGPAAADQSSLKTVPVRAGHRRRQRAGHETGSSHSSGG